MYQFNVFVKHLKREYCGDMSAEMVDQQSWNTRVLSHPSGSFLQSWQWGQLQEELHLPWWRLQGNHFQALVIQRPLPLGYSWLYIPGGPVIEAEGVEEFEKQITKLAQTKKALFVRMDPHWQEWPSAQLPHWQKASHEVQPQHTIVLDTTKSEEQLLTEMHPKLRYNIRLAQKKGVTVKFSNDTKDLQHFFTIARDVSSRSPFRYHPESYYTAIVKVLAQADMVDIALGEYNGTVLAAHILIRFGDTMTYVHGASSNNERNVMAPHLVQWESIKRAKAHGLAHYDFYGVAPVGASATHPWTGITRLKESFGGTRKEYVGAYDLVINRLGYTAYTMLHRLRKK